MAIGQSDYESIGSQIKYLIQEVDELMTFKGKGSDWDSLNDLNGHLNEAQKVLSQMPTQQDEIDKSADM